MKLVQDWSHKPWVTNSETYVKTLYVRPKILTRRRKGEPVQAFAKLFVLHANTKTEQRN